MWFFLPVMAYILCLLAGRYIYNPIRRKGYTMRKEVNENPIIRIAIIIMSLYVAFAVGANNVANAAGPITTMIMKELNMKNEKWKNDFAPIDEHGTATIDKVHSKAYLRHLFAAKELLGMQIASIHNLAFYLWLVEEARNHILAGDFAAWKKEMVYHLGKRL